MLVSVKLFVCWCYMSPATDLRLPLCPMTDPSHAALSVVIEAHVGYRSCVLLIMTQFYALLLLLCDISYFGCHF